MIAVDIGNDLNKLLKLALLEFDEHNNFSEGSCEPNKDVQVI